MLSYPPVINPKAAKDNSSKFLQIIKNSSGSSFLVRTRYSARTGKTRASDVEHTAPISEIKSPTLGTAKATTNVTIIMKIRKIISLVIG